MTQQGIIPRLLQALAGLVHALGNMLERVAGERQPNVRSAALQALSDRFPGAPDHWLQMIAERAPQLVEAPTAEVAPEPPGRPPSPLIWPFGRRRPRAETTPGPRPAIRRPEPDAATTPDLDVLAAAVAALPTLLSKRPRGPSLSLSPQKGKVARPSLLFMAHLKDRRPTSDNPAKPASSGAATSAEAYARPAPKLRPAIAFMDPSTRPQAILEAAGAAKAEGKQPTARSWAPPAPRAPAAGRDPWPSLDEAPPTPPAADAAPSAPRSPEPQTWRLEGEGAKGRSWKAPETPGRDPWRHEAGPATAQAASRSVPTFLQRPPSDERASFGQQHDDRWPDLPPPGEDEVMGAPAHQVARHIREQQEGRWSA